MTQSPLAQLAHETATQVQAARALRRAARAKQELLSTLRRAESTVWILEREIARLERRATHPQVSPERQAKASARSRTLRVQLPEAALRSAQAEAAFRAAFV